MQPLENILPENWDALNQRRHELIDKKHGGQEPLTEAEAKELDDLQELAGRVRDALTPPFPPELQRSIDELPY